MKIAGINKNSFVDMKGMIAYVIFTPGCNFDCWYCHNRHIIGDIEELYDTEMVLQDIKDRKRFVDIVVISGGEPTLQKGLEDYIRAIRDIGIAVKLDTNGTNPKVLERLIQEGLLDYIAMDYKAPIHKYDEIAGCKVDREDILKSIELIMNGGIQYEFRTTFSPDMVTKDLVEIAKSIPDARQYVIQQFVPHDNMTRKSIAPHSREYVLKAVEECNRYVPTIVKGIGMQ